MNTLSFKKILVANRGEIAMRVLRCLRQLDIQSVLIYHRSDQHSPWVQQADEAVEVTGESPSGAFLDIPQIVDICQQYQVDAVHPGYGFLSENAAFAKALEKASIRFIGPSPEVIELMGDKIRSRQFVQEHGFPVSPSVSMNLDDAGFVDAVQAIGFPLVVKASAGGGGKGMSIVRNMEDLQSTMDIAGSEAEKYFGDKRVYIEPYFERARHIEVQVLGDGQQVIHLGERECSIQRRFQKVIEETPAIAISEENRSQICQTAVGIAQAANYSNAGTVEFLYTQDHQFYFLEMNTRIQVEHPVTEMVTAIDLVAEQIKLAAGQPLSIAQAQVISNGHAIECRICAEDADNDFTPETGTVLFLKIPEGEGIRFDSSLYPCQRITTAYDPMLAKLVVHAQTRELAIGKMIEALQQLVILGIKTNVDFLVRLLQHADFVDGAINTDFIKISKDDLQQSSLTNTQQQTILAAALLSDHSIQQLQNITPEPYLAMGSWRN